MLQNSCTMVVIFFIYLSLFFIIIIMYAIHYAIYFKGFCPHEDYLYYLFLGNKITNK